MKSALALALVLTACTSTVDLGAMTKGTGEFGGTNRLVRGESEKLLHFTFVYVYTDRATRIGLIEGKGILCDTYTQNLFYIPLGDNTGWMMGERSRLSEHALLTTMAPGDDLCLTQSNGAQITGEIHYRSMR